MIVRGSDSRGRILVHCSAGCEEVLPLTKSDYMDRMAHGQPAPVCWVCRMAAGLEMMAAQALEKKAEPPKWGYE